MRRVSGGQASERRAGERRDDALAKGRPSAGRSGGAAASRSGSPGALGRGDAGRGGGAPRATGNRARPKSAKATSEMVAGRNSVVEALRAGVPVKTMYVAGRIDVDDRVREALRIALGRGIAMLETPRGELDRLTDGAIHQGLALQVPPYEYAHPGDLLRRRRTPVRRRSSLRSTASPTPATWAPSSAQWRLSAARSDRALSAGRLA
jgi:23S rRNA (guanosine2251-2'-O)-methyltransferase